MLNLFLDHWHEGYQLIKEPKKNEFGSILLGKQNLECVITEDQWKIISFLTKLSVHFSRPHLIELVRTIQHLKDMEFAEKEAGEAI